MTNLFKHGVDFEEANRFEWSEALVKPINASLTTMSQKLIRRTDDEDAAVTKAAEDDPDNPPLSNAELQALVPGRGRPRLLRPKVQVSIRYSPEVVDFFRSTGKGWQARIDAVLKDYVRSQR